MILKDLIKAPEDFVVKEVARIEPVSDGDFCLYLLKKRNTTTWDVLGDISKRFRRSLKDIGYGGLKDKFAVSYQYLTIKNGPKKDILAKNYELSYLGQSKVSMSKDLLEGNVFEITLRSAPKSFDEIKKELRLVEEFGVVNYFDDQRFGSIRHKEGFCAKEIIKKNYERALYLLLVEGSHYDFLKTIGFRRCLKKFWGDFSKCIDKAPSPWEKNLVEFLAKNKRSKRTFKRALGLVNKEYLLMLCQSYQAYIWNEVAKELLKYKAVKYEEVPYIAGSLYFYRQTSKDFLEYAKNLRIPLPSPKLHLSEELKIMFQRVLEKEGIKELKMFRTLVKGAIFKSYPRPFLTFPSNISLKTSQNSIKLSFFLPKGSYATIVLKRLLFTLPAVMNSLQLAGFYFNFPGLLF